MQNMPHVSRRAYEVPPLELLVAFEAAARHLSFTRAGDEIALTQSAVSRQIQALEERLGVRCSGACIAPWCSPRRAAPFQQATTEALATIDRASRALRQGSETRPVVVSTTAGFAGVWLIPRLTAFVAAHPGVDVRISTGNNLANLERDGVDVAVRYRSVDLLPAGAVPLFGETVFPVCSPRLLRAAGAALKVPADLAGQTLLKMEPDGSNHLQDWGLWLHAMQLTQLKPAAVLHFSSYDQLIQAAVAGQGVALGRVPLIDRC
jgi:DNA-binding transcriptional LysR family regulator